MSADRYDRPHTHTQYHDHAADDDKPCRPGEHRYIDDEGEAFVCARCGDVMEEPERTLAWDGQHPFRFPVAEGADEQ